DLPRQRFDTASGRLKRALIANARAHRTALERATMRLRPQMVARATVAGRERLTRLDRSSTRAVHTMLERSQRRLDVQAKLLQTLGYHNVLARGFALVRDADGSMVRRAFEVISGAALDIEFADGHVGARADARPRKKEGGRKKHGGASDKQGTLL